MPWRRGIVELGWIAVLAATVALADPGSVPIGAQAQAQAGDLPPAAFEAASVKLDIEQTAQPGIRPVVGNRFTAFVTVRMLIALAYGVPSALLDAQIADAPGWTGTDRFEINATFDGPITATPGGPPLRLLAMIRSLLADRFRLRLHAETRQLPVYDLLVERADGQLGPRLTRAAGTCVRVSGALPPNVDFTTLCGFRRVSPSVISGKSLTLEALAGALGQRAEVQRIVRDRTALTGEFDVDLEYAPFTGAADPPPGPGLTTALREQLGLALRSTIGPVQVHVVDSVERPGPD